MSLYIVWDDCINDDDDDGVIKTWMSKLAKTLQVAEDVEQSDSDSSTYWHQKMQ